MKFIGFLKELKRRSVYKVATVYAITAWLLAQIINLAADAFNAPEWVMQMVIVLLMAGFPIALILAWAFEITPGGFKRTSSLATANNADTTNKRGSNIWMISLLVTAVVFLAFDKFYLSETSFWDNEPRVKQASIAVLPFADFSAEGDQEYFADGISEELLNSLANVKDLHVAGRTSSFQFKDKNRDLREIGNKLGVDHILEGSVRKAGNQLRITAQLIKIEDGFHIWSNTYDRQYSAENVFDIQDEISREVLKELKVRLLPSDKNDFEKVRPTENIEAYNLYLKGLSKAATLNPSDLEEAEAYFNKATTLDPDFALAYAKKAESLIFQHMMGNAEYSKTVEESGKAIDWALLLQDDLAEAYVALGFNHLLQQQKESSLLAFKKAKKLKPGDAEISASLGIGLWQKNEREKAQEELEYAFKLDPLSPLVNLYLGEIYQMNGEYKKAEDHLKQAIKLLPGYLVAYESLVNLYGARLGQHDKALITMYKAYNEHAEKSKAVSMIFYPAVDLGLYGLAKNALNELKTDFPNNIATLRTELYWLANKKEFQKGINVVKEFDSLKMQLPPPFYVDQVSGFYLAAEKHKELIDLIKEKSPEVLRTDTLDFDNRSFNNMLAAVAALRKTGEQQKADLILNNLDTHLQKLPKKDTQEYEGRYFWQYTICRGFKGDKAAVKNAFKKRVENGNFIGHALVYGIENDVYFNLGPEEIRPFKQAEEKIIKEQRNSVISYLKKEGEWKEEWNVQ
ncbi:tetratricopeptide repeat protein [Salinimicrobium flavum]|uniref:Tetratricopeptide repeat protein n=1 Tax=Salinimicrobium flavum TaxID=1737065 RepID=A0ABW5J0F5_9FLAO